MTTYRTPAVVTRKLRSKELPEAFIQSTWASATLKIENASKRRLTAKADTRRELRKIRNLLRK